MEYIIVEHGVITNIIVCENDKEAAEHGAIPRYKGAAIGDVYPPEKTPEALREEAYNTEEIIAWNGEMITVTQAATLWMYYSSEGSNTAPTLQLLISEAKASIREKYPDEGAGT